MAESEIRLINTIEELKLYKVEWQKLLKENGNNNPFLEFDWIESWWTYFGNGKELFVLLIIENDMIMGFIPLMITNRKLHKEITFISSYIDASYMDFILEKNKNENCINLAFDYIKILKGNYIIKLFGFYGDSINAQLLKGYLISTKSGYHIYNFESPYIKTDKDYNTYYKERSKFSSLRTLKRSKKKLYSAGNVAYKKLESNQFEMMFKLHEKRWRKKFDFSKLTEKQHQDFYKSLALNNDLSFKAHADGLMVGEKLIGFIYGFECNGNFIYYRIAHDDDFSVFGPGKIVFEEMLNKCFNNKIDIIDLGIGYARYKYEWTDDNAIVKEFVIASNTIIAKLLLSKYQLKKKLIAFMKKFRWYGSFKIYTLGKVKYLLTGGYVKDIKSTLKKVKDDKQLLRIRINHLLCNIYSMGKYFIYEKHLYSRTEETKGNEHINEVIKKDEEGLVHEVNLNHIDLLSEIMSRPANEIVKRFYNKQRCFVYDDGSEKGYFWVETKEIKIPAIKYEKRLEDKMIGKNAFILIEDTLSNCILTKQALSHISNILQEADFEKVFLAFKDNNEHLENSLKEIEFQPYQTIKYRIVFFKVLHNLTNYEYL